MTARLPERLDPGITEKAFGAYVERAATDAGWLWMHVRPLLVPKRGGKFITPASAGFPDYVMVHPAWPRLFVLELKSSAGVVSPRQRRWLNLLGRIDSVDAWWAGPDHWPRIRAHLAAPETRKAG